ncbi:Alpha/Beta hydrolase protein [Absidia repens]|uniref:Alpha/Beta hydrolase protein n=1 Tax=Absidia repens TaxID=90262 RepID=A0A1X2IM10_9FUNG|nr:Alpha/Beta hydrolase protein [Absidia repens]
MHYWLATEVMFYIFFQVTRNRMQHRGSSGNTLTRKERRSLVTLCIANVNNVQEWLPGWFIKKDGQHPAVVPAFEEIYLENVVEWVSWAFFTAPLEDVLQHSELVKEIDWMIGKVERKFQVKFPNGYNQHIHSRRLNLDPINAYHRPLVFYVGVQVLNFLYGVAVLQGHYGMKKYGPEAVIDSDFLWNQLVEIPSNKMDAERISYWFRDGDRSKKPIVFIHGIGAGLMCYTPFIHQLMQLDVPIFCIELPFIAMRCIEDVPTMQEISHDIQQMLHRHDCQNAVFVAHSLGTAVASWTLQHLPKTVAGVVLLDPICFMLHYNDICTNFVYRTPKTASESVVKYFASSELYISHYISRHFYWFQCALYVTPTTTTDQRKSHKRNLGSLPPSPSCSTSILATTPMPPHTKIYLSEFDNIVNSTRVNSYLVENGINTEMMTGLDHASFLMDSLWQKRIISTLSHYISSK